MVKAWYYRGELHRSGEPALILEQMNYSWVMQDDLIAGMDWCHNEQCADVRVHYKHGNCLDAVRWQNYWVITDNMTAEWEPSEQLINIRFTPCRKDRLNMSA